MLVLKRAERTLSFEGRNHQLLRTASAQNPPHLLGFPVLLSHVSSIQSVTAGSLRVCGGDAEDTGPQ